LLTTERLLLRKPTADDAEAVIGLLGDIEVMRYLGGEPVPPEAVPAAVQRWVDAWQRDGIGKFLVERLADGAVVGRVGVNVWDASGWNVSSFAAAGEHAQPELGWALAREHWGRGYAVESARAVRDWLDAEHGYERLISLVRPDNVRSQRVAERLGARRVETVTERGSGDPLVVWLHPRP
jgi:RimJ/RimL family protein N-acetyltransferase